MYLQFFGAAGTTTGSSHLLHFGDFKILLDCGLYQGPRKQTYEKNLNFAFDPGSIHSVILSHAHIDHSGNLPNLVKQGFKGVIFATSATQDLCGAMLRDSAYIQEKDAEFLNKRNSRRNQPPVTPLYTIGDAEACLFNFHGIPYQRPFHVLRDLQCQFLDAGHILGSAVTVVDAKEDGAQKRIVYTGDVGRYDLPILRDPQSPQEANAIIIESTYGARKHDDIQEVESKLAAIVNRVVERRGKIIIPSFAVGRSQEMIYSLHNLARAGKLPEIPIYVDSPLAINATEIFRHHPECFDEAARKHLLEDDDIFGFDRLEYVRSVERSKELNTLKGPCIIISASGMCEVGRILHHLRNNIEDERNMILFIGFQAEQTLGRRIVEGQKVVKIFGEEFPVRAEVKSLQAFSAHADADELIAFLRPVVQSSPDLRQIFIVHGEPTQSQALSKRVEFEFGIKPEIPQRGEKFKIQ